MNRKALIFVMALFLVACSMPLKDVGDSQDAVLVSDNKKSVPFDTSYFVKSTSNNNVIQYDSAILQKLNLKMKDYRQYNDDFLIKVSSQEDKIVESTSVMIDSSFLCITNVLGKNHLDTVTVYFAGQNIVVSNDLDEADIDILSANNVNGFLFDYRGSYFLVSKDNSHVIIVTTITSLSGTRAGCRLVSEIDLKKLKLVSRFECPN